MKPPKVDPAMLGAINRERALIQQLFGGTPKLDVPSQLWSFECTAGDPTKAPEGLFSVGINVSRTARWVVAIWRIDVARDLEATGTAAARGAEHQLIFTTDLPGASFVEALNVVHTVLMELAKGKEPTE